MNFEFDKQKSGANKQKHGIDFIEAQTLWQDDNRIIYPAKSADEPRYAMIAICKSKLWTAFYTTRNQRLRLISVRHSRESEKELYES